MDFLRHRGQRLAHDLTQSLYGLDSLHDVGFQIKEIVKTATASL